jgi:hypothetical protein
MGACTKPLKGWRANYVNANGKRPIVFNRKDAFLDMPVDVPCGNCIGCRLQRSRSWGLRCMHEASFHTSNMFLTLTYSDENLPENANLKKRDFQLFMKRLRKYVQPTKIRFYHCGEYGKNDPQNKKHQQLYKASSLGRPHYHAIIFGYTFDDGIPVSIKGGHRLYMSPVCEKLWPHGYNTYGSVTYESAAYVARYCVKKINGINAKEHYTRTDPDTGEVVELQPEYTTMSRGGKSKDNNLGGIGKRWFDKYKDDCYPKDFVTHKGKELRPPRYYDDLLEKEDIDRYKQVKLKRASMAKKANKDVTAEMIRANHLNTLSKNKQLIRELDND